MPPLPQESSIHWGQQLKLARDKADLTQKEASELSGISQGTLSVVEGKHDMMTTTIVKLCRAYKLTVIELLQLK